MPRVDVYLENMIEDIDYAKRILLIETLENEDEEK